MFERLGAGRDGCCSGMLTVHIGALRIVVQAKHRVAGKAYLLY